MKPTLYIVVPVFNEAGNMHGLFFSLGRLAEAASREFVVSLVIVDDGSTDGTARKVNALCDGRRCSLLTHAVNKGPGAAFATAFSHIGEKAGGDDWVLTMEGDNTSDIDTIKQMLVRRHEGYDVVLGSPYAYSGGFSNVALWRVFLSHVANGLVKILMGIRGLHTFSSFLRLYRASTIFKLQTLYGRGIVRSKGFECMVELLAMLVREGFRISEVETQVDWSKRSGKSKMKIGRTVLGYLRLFISWTMNKNKARNESSM